MVLDTLREAKAETINDTVVNVQVKSVIDTPPEPLSEMNAKTPGDTLANVDVVVLFASVLDSASTSLLASVVFRALGFMWASVMEGFPAIPLGSASVKVSKGALASTHYKV